MALNNQIHIYSFDTGDFYFRKERKYHNLIHKLKKERNKLKKELDHLNNRLLYYGCNKEIELMFNNNDYSFVPENEEYAYIGLFIIELLSRKYHVKKYLDYKVILIEIGRASCRERV